jgi:hypothetical protein
VDYQSPSVANFVSTYDDPNADFTNKAISHLRRMRYFRKQYDQRRAYFFRQYLGQRDQRFYPDNITPRSNTFVPYPLSNIEGIVSRILDAFFSYEEWFECKGRSAKDESAAEKMQTVLLRLLKRSSFIPAFESLVRNAAIYGHAAMKVDWDWDYETVTYSQPIPMIGPDGQPIVQPVMNPDTMQPEMQPVILGYRPAQKQVLKNRPRFLAIDVYDLLIDPDGGIVAHLTERTLGQMVREQTMSMQAAMDDPSKKPLYLPEAFDKLVKRVSENVGKPDNPMDTVIRLAEVWDEYAQTQSILTYGEDAEAISWKDLRASYRAAGYSPFKRKVYAGIPLLLYHGEIPFMHKKAPIICTNFIKLPNEVFGLGAIEIISDLTESLNKFVNMVTDNWNLSINRRYAYDTNADIDHEALNSFNVPGGKVGVVGDPSKVIMPLPFFTPAAGDYQILDVYKMMIETASGVSDFYSKGVGSPTGNKTATGISNVMQESNFRFKMFIRNLEIDILQPLLTMCASMVQQYISDPMEVQITGENPQIKKWVTLQPEELIGTLDFDLVAANYASNRMVRQRNIMALINIMASNPVFAPYVNPYETAKELYKAFEIRNINKLLVPPPQVQMMQLQEQDKQVKMMMLQAMMDTEGKARLAQAKPQTGTGKDGRPRKAQFEGKIPGANLMSPIRDLAQSMGANALGMEGLGQVPEGE